ncbi:hypothetical protein [Rhizobium ruizarguesonis]|jgi:hypothetical protein|uniref:hypothetical protein n=1 Tax=Rhizobium ruizarguesonis TaxID=2081791 RepID=UPI001FDF26C1|nr:hypothetical protein [Rhizobium ruizarguesonis]
MIEIEPVRGTDPALKALLDGAGLPTDDLQGVGRIFFIAAENGSVVPAVLNRRAAISCSGRLP